MSAMGLGSAQNADVPGPDFRRLEVRLGSKKTAMAIAHKLLGIIYRLLAEGTFYDEQRYDHLQPQQEDRQRK